MSLWMIAWRSIGYRRLASGLTAFSMSLGVALVVMIIVIHGVISDSFNRSSQGYDLVVGPSKGSALDVVLSTVFYIKPPVGTIGQLSQGVAQRQVLIGRGVGDPGRDRPPFSPVPDRRDPGRIFRETRIHGRPQVRILAGQKH